MPISSRLLIAAAAWMLVTGLLASGHGADKSRADEFQAMAQDSIVPPDSQLEPVWNEGEFTEGPIVAGDGAILFSDIGDRIMRFDPVGKQTTEFRAPSGKSNGLKFNAKGELIACEGAGAGGNRRISITDTSGKVRSLADRYHGKRFNSPNDLAIAPSGDVYFTDPRYVGDDPRELDFEGVFLVKPNGTVQVATRDVEKPNGIIVTPDGKTVYVSDNNSRADGNHQLLSFMVQPDGTLADKGVLFDFGPNRRAIDGMTLDAEGNIYATAGRGKEAGVYVFSAHGAPLAFIATPGDPTNCVFGVGGEATTLYVTSATMQPAAAGMRPPYGLYRIRLIKPGYRLFPKG
ncbi:MAG: SMP-30/gluconolactonase/LRE family protein [Pirellulales bacterium]